MNAISMEILGGLPTSRFVGRFIQAKIPDLGFSRCKCIEALWGKMVVEVKVKQNRRHYQIPIADCSPNWADNKDLMWEADRAKANPEALKDLKDEIDRRKGSFANPPKSVVVHKTPPAAVAAAPKPEPQPVVIPPPVQPVLPVKTSIRLDIDEDADITWTEDYKILQASVMEMDEITAAKATLIARERSNGELIAMCLAEMSRKGVHVLNALTQTEEPVRTIAVTAPEVPLPVQTDPVPVREDPVPEPESTKDLLGETASGPSFKRISAEQMNKNRAAAQQALRTMPPRIPHDIKDILKLAGLEGNKSLNGPILEMAEATPKIVVAWQETQRGRKRIFTRTT